LKILLDTNALIWLISGAESRLLGPRSLAQLKEADAVYVSSISILEIRIKTMLGKLESGDDLVVDIAEAGLKELPFDASHADAIRNFPNVAKHDPFDRMLIAQALIEGMTLLTSDATVLGLNLHFTANARG
jgi:PIN domain nuclease of toxin-antitoxin system